MSRSKGSPRFGRIIFLIPVVVIVALVFFAIFDTGATQPGTLDVVAESSGRYSPSVQLHVSVAVGSTVETSPFNFSLSQGQYLVTYGPAEWYVTPPSRLVSVLSGRMQYAIGTYEPLIRAISINQTGFNATSITALHGVTPVVWINQGASRVILEIDSIGNIPLNPSQNYTTVLPSQGTYSFDIFNTRFGGTVTSK
jgi:hypothetical protein